MKSRMIKCPWRSAIIECRTCIEIWWNLECFEVPTSGIIRVFTILAAGEKDCKLNGRKRICRDHIGEHSPTVDTCWVAQIPTNGRQNEVHLRFMFHQPRPTSRCPSIPHSILCHQVESFGDVILSHDPKPSQTLILVWQRFCWVFFCES